MNTLIFVDAIQNQLAAAGLATWLFGGWAEELHGLIRPRAHQDIDLLYPAPSFAELEVFFDRQAPFIEIGAKRQSHKRAARVEGVLIEFFLLQQTDSGYITNFFDGRYLHQWPADVLSWLKSNGAAQRPLASRQALATYRRHHPRVEQVRAQHYAELK